MIALAGYTNAGKSTLFNTLIQAEVFADEIHTRKILPSLSLSNLGLKSAKQSILFMTKILGTW
jgi:ribosome biogenesis GTPase A